MTVKASRNKAIVIGGIEYSSKTAAIRALLAGGERKANIAKATCSHYAFVSTVEKKMLFEASDEGQAKIKELAQKKAERAEAQRLERIEKDKRKAERRAKAEERKALKAKDDKAKAAKKHQKQTKLAKAAKALNINPVIIENELTDDDVLIDDSNFLNENIPEHIANDMSKDGDMEI